MAREEVEAFARTSPLEVMLAVAASRPPQAPLAPSPTYVPVSEELADTARETLEGVEMSMGVSRAVARAAAASLLAAGQAIEAPYELGGAPQETVREIEALLKDIRADSVCLLAKGAPTADAQVEADDAAAPRSHGAAP
jgi:hypothetical protein